MRNRDLLKETPFYVLRPAFSGAYLGTWGRGAESLPTEEFANGTQVPREPVLIKHSEGSGKPSDVVWTDSFLPFFVSASVQETLVREELCGWRTFPATVLTRRRAAVEGYAGFVITGKSGPYKLGPALDLTQPVREHVGVMLNPAEWDGSDFFFSEGKDGYRGGFVFVSQRARDVLISAGITNVNLCPAAELRVPV